MPLSNNPTLTRLESSVARFVDWLNAWLIEHPFIFGFQLIIFAVGFFFVSSSSSTPPPPPQSRLKQVSAEASKAAAAGMGLQAPDVKLDPPKDDPISTERLKKCDGSVEGEPIYVAIKGTVFDVTHKRESYGPGQGYNVFAGKDASNALGKSSLKPEDAFADYSSLTPEELKVLDDWFAYFSKRYNIVGKVVD